MPETGSWWTLAAIRDETIAERQAEESQPQQACACGWPLRTGPNGELYCPHGDTATY